MRTHKEFVDILNKEIDGTNARYIADLSRNGIAPAAIQTIGGAELSLAALACMDQAEFSLAFTDNDDFATHAGELVALGIKAGCDISIHTDIMNHFVTTIVTMKAKL